MIRSPFLLSAENNKYTTSDIVKCPSHNILWLGLFAFPTERALRDIIPYLRYISDCQYSWEPTRNRAQ